jgi:hypothetical protein
MKKQFQFFASAVVVFGIMVAVFAAHDGANALGLPNWAWWLWVFSVVTAGAAVAKMNGENWQFLGGLVSPLAGVALMGIAAPADPSTPLGAVNITAILSQFVTVGCWLGVVVIPVCSAVNAAFLAWGPENVNKNPQSSKT